MAGDFVHGRGHRLTPTDLNYRANIWGLKRLGATAVISVSAVGSMKEEIRPLDIVIIDQLFDHRGGLHPRAAGGQCFAGAPGPAAHPGEPHAGEVLYRLGSPQTDDRIGESDGREPDLAGPEG